MVPGAWILLILPASLLALLAVPVDLTFCVRRGEGRREASATLGWLFGAVRLRLGAPGMTAEAKPGHPGYRWRPRRHGGARRIKAVIGVEGFAGRLLRLARNLLRRIDVRDVSIAVRLGLDDPADTGRLWGLIGPLAAILAAPPVAQIAIEPDFTSETFGIDGRGSLRFIPVQLLFVILVFVLSPGTLRAVHALRRPPR